MMGYDFIPGTLFISMVHSARFTYHFTISVNTSMKMKNVMRGIKLSLIVGILEGLDDFVEGLDDSLKKHLHESMTDKFG